MAAEINTDSTNVKYEDKPTSIKFHVKKFIQKEQHRLRGKKVVDFPAGNGVTSKILRDAGAEVLPFDLFPEYFKVEGLECKRADILKGIPIEDGSVDYVLCQEGIEHFSDQANALKEFARILTKGGSLILTTPNYGNLRARLSYLLAESERFNKLMAPNELDSVWMSTNKDLNEVYYGHIFLIGIQKLRCLAVLAGFRIKNIRFTRLKTTSLLLFPFYYPFIVIANYLAYWRSMKRNKHIPLAQRRASYGEVLRLAIRPSLLIDGHLFVELEKVQEAGEVAAQMRSVHSEFGTT